MKKTALSLLTASILVLTSCSESSNEYHMFAMPYPVGAEIQYYADQEKDSLVIQSTDSWKIVQERGDWMSFSQESLTLKPGYYAQQIVLLSFDANTTNEARTTTAAVTANGKTFRKSFTQVPYVNVIRPARDLTAETPTFVLTDSAHYVSDSIMFTTYAKKAEIESKADWIEPQTTSFERAVDNKRPRQYTCYLKLTPNSTEEERSGELILTTSNGCSTTISIRQLPKKAKP